MNTLGNIVGAPGWVTRLQQFVSETPARAHCELCGEPLTRGHAHLVEPATRRVLCACSGCALLFEPRSATRFRRVPTYAMRLPGLQLTDEQWRALGVPIDIAFFFDSSSEGRPIALYPGAAGLVEAAPDEQSWAALKRASPPLAALMPDVEALLVNRLHAARDCYRMPIDRCYALAGVIRQHWRGLSGGTQVWQAVERYFVELQKELVVQRAHV